MKTGYVVLMSQDRSTGRCPSYEELRAEARHSEELGFDSLWLYDHLLYQDEGEVLGIWECFSVLAALAEATERVELGTLVACTQFRNPALLAKMAITIDEISAGRLTLGIGAGWNKLEFEAFGYQFDHRVSRFAEAADIIRSLLREGRQDFAGTYYQLRDCIMAPRGPRPGGIPLLLGGFGERMLRLTARYADAWNSGYLAVPGDLEPWLPRLEAACRAEGRDPATLAITVLIKVADPAREPPPHFMEGKYLRTPEEIADALHGFAHLGVQHAMFEAFPRTRATLERVAEGVRLFRASAG